ncbi:TRAP transporter substrate-binding protein [Rubrivirga marina]|uniref:ABC transporter substrate-binding protein n=1 Tax=Rubrivirga marina TaxID=1196024 RepID=A0A271J0M6_9BACT|nr:ABC transporter substrate-binding protein [Rubrivirga marina]PAP77052.1 ABC transporter substrate-binding protein [Rubrivirga marina]
MDRRRFVSAAALGAGATLAGCGPGPGHGRRETGAAAGGPAIVTRPRVRWRLASSFPRSTEILYRAAEHLAQRVAALTDGRFEIEPNEGGALVPPLQVLDAVQAGSVPIGHTAGYYYLGKTAALTFDTAVPFGMQARQHDAWMRHGGGRELTQRTLDAFGVVGLLGGNTGTQMGGWFRRPVRSLSDLRALTMRIPGLGGRAMEQLGVIAQTLPGGEIYGALERGAIDATEWVGPYDDEKMGFYRVVKTYHYPGWWEPSAGLSFYVNRSEWDRLPPSYREALQTASGEVNAIMLSEYDALNAPALASLLDRGVEAVPFPPDVMAAAAQASRALMDNAADDAHSRELLQSYRDFQAATDRWFNLAERTMAQAYGSGGRGPRVA